MKKLFQYVFFGYRNPTRAETPKGGSHLTFEGGSPQEKFNAMLSLKKEVLKRKYRDWNIEQKEVIN